jgi:hypothetical protein
MQQRRMKARRLALIGVLPIFCRKNVGGRGDENNLCCDGSLKGRAAPAVLVGAAQLRATVDSSC